MRHKLNSLVEPLFIISLSVLLLNDLLFKQYFPNFITGKLSDFAGIAVFLMFWSAILPKCRNWIFVFTPILFAYWKSPFSQILIDMWNSSGILPVSRVCDLMDLAALIILPAIYYYKPRKFNLTFIRIPLALLSLFAFCATSYNSSIEFNKKYSFPFSINELVFRINHLNSGCKMAPLSLNFRAADTTIIWGEDTNFISYGDSVYRFSDTLYKYNNLLKRSTNEIDTIYNFVNRNADTNYVHGRNPVEIKFDGSAMIRDTGYSYCDCFEAHIIIGGNADTSSINLRSINAGGCIYKLKSIYKDKELNGILLSTFEREVIKKIFWK